MDTLRLSHEHFQSVKFIAATAQVLPDEIKLATTKGFNTVLKKPFDAAALLQVLLSSNTSEFKYKDYFEKSNVDNEMTELFKNEMHKDIMQMYDFVMQGDEASLNFVLHIVATRLGQMNHKEESKEARALEIVTKSGQLPVQRTLSFLKSLELLIKV